MQKIIFIILLLFFHVKMIYYNVLYIIYNVLYIIDKILMYIYRSAIKKLDINILMFLYIYYICFVYYVTTYLLTSSTYILYLFINMEFRKALYLLIEVSRLLFFWYLIGLSKTLFFFNWFLIYSFIKYYKRSKVSDSSRKFLEILTSFFFKTVMHYRKKTMDIVTLVQKEKRLEWKHSKNEYFWVFIFDIFTLLLITLIAFFWYN